MKSLTFIVGESPECPYRISGLLQRVVFTYTVSLGPWLAGGIECKLTNIHLDESSGDRSPLSTHCTHTQHKENGESDCECHDELTRGSGVVFQLLAYSLASAGSIRTIYMLGIIGIDAVTHMTSRHYIIQT